MTALADLPYEVTVARWKFELARFGGVCDLPSFLLTLVVPLVALPVITGHDGVYVP